MAYLWPVLFALALWWASTALIIYLDNLPPRTFKWSMLGATVVFAGAAWGLAATARSATPNGAYAAFACGLAAWGWGQMSFYTGYLTGPRREKRRPNVRGWLHFVHALQTSLWHELAILLTAVGIVWLTWSGPNQIGTWTFMTLWWMHLSAKLNVFLGVRNLNEEFFPAHLAFLRSYLRRRPMNLLFPISVTVSTVVCVRLADAAFASDVGAFDLVGYTVLAVLMALAILEHWFLVVPLPSAALWTPALRARERRRAFELEARAAAAGEGAASGDA